MSTNIEDRIWGTIAIRDPLIEELINSPEIQRLKRIAQAGITAYLEPERDTTRFEHSIGVFYLLEKFGCTREEQVAGLIHDFTHTAFSHVIDYVYTNSSQSYHEEGFEKKYRESSLYRIIQKYKMNPELFIDLERFTILEQPIPNLCVDRLDYFIRDYLISTKDKKNIFLWINSLKVNTEKLLFTDNEIAERFGLAFLNEMENTWFSPRGVYSYSLFAQLLGKALQRNIITPSSFETDDQTLLTILQTKMRNEYGLFLSESKKDIKITPSKGEGTYPYIGKFRYIDPLVEISGKATQLSSFNLQFSKKIDSLKKLYSELRFISPQ
ncbi:MAG: HD domain-containing protein [Microgenomates group bacterium]